jgi:hypothetical protein
MPLHDQFRAKLTLMSDWGHASGSSPSALGRLVARRREKVPRRNGNYVNTDITIETPFVEADDTYHEPSSPDQQWVETNWWSLNVPERGIGAWLHCGYHANRNEVTWRVFVWDPSGSDPGQLAYYRRKTDVEMPAQFDLRDLTFPDDGYRVKMLNPLMDYHITYADSAENFSIEFEHHSVHPPHRFTPGEAPCVHNPHIDQLGHVTGELVLRGERIAIDCHSVRDRTWGPRPGHDGAQPRSRAREARARVRYPGGPAWRSVERERGRGRIQYIFGHTDDQIGFLSFVRPQDGTADGWSPLNMGWLLKEGRFERLDKSKSRMKND